MNDDSASPRLVPPFWKLRVAARVLDLLIALLVMLATAYGWFWTRRIDFEPFDLMRASTLVFDSILRGVVMTTLAWAVVEVVATARKGATPGKQLAGLRVVTVDGRSVGWGRSAARLAAFTGLLLAGLLTHGVVLAAGLVAPALWRNDGRSGADLLAGTRVISTNPAAPATPAASPLTRTFAGSLVFVVVVMWFATLVS